MPWVYAILLAGSGVESAFEPVLVAGITAGGAILAAFITSRGAAKDRDIAAELARELENERREREGREPLPQRPDPPPRRRRPIRRKRTS